MRFLHPCIILEPKLAPEFEKMERLRIPKHSISGNCDDRNDWDCINNAMIVYVGLTHEPNINNKTINSSSKLQDIKFLFNKAEPLLNAVLQSHTFAFCEDLVSKLIFIDNKANVCNVLERKQKRNWTDKEYFDFNKEICGKLEEKSSNYDSLIYIMSCPNERFYSFGESEYLKNNSAQSWRDNIISMFNSSRELQNKHKMFIFNIETTPNVSIPQFYLETHNSKTQAMFVKKQIENDNFIPIITLLELFCAKLFQQQKPMLELKGQLYSRYAKNCDKGRNNWQFDSSILNALFVKKIVRANRNEQGTDEFDSQTGSSEVSEELVNVVTKDLKCKNSRKAFELLAGCTFGSQTRDPLQKLTNGKFDTDTTKAAIQDAKQVLVSSLKPQSESKNSESKSSDENDFQSIFDAMKHLNVSNEKELTQACWQWWNTWIKISLFYGNVAYFELENKKLRKLLVFRIPCGLNIINDGSFQTKEWHEVFLALGKEDGDSYWRYYKVFDKTLLLDSLNFDACYSGTKVEAFFDWCLPRSTLPVIKREIKSVREKCRRVNLRRKLDTFATIKVKKFFAMDKGKKCHQKRLNTLGIEKQDLLEYAKSNGTDTSKIMRLNIGKYVQIYVTFNQTGLNLKFEPIMELKVKNNETRFGFAMNTATFPASLEVVTVVNYHTMIRNGRYGTIDPSFDEFNEFSSFRFRFVCFLLLVS